MEDCWQENQSTRAELGREDVQGRSPGHALCMLPSLRGAAGPKGSSSLWVEGELCSLSQHPDVHRAKVY